MSTPATRQPSVSRLFAQYVQSRSAGPLVTEADVEPSEEWKQDLQRRIEARLQGMVDDAKRSLESGRKQAPVASLYQEQLAQEYAAAMSSIRRLAAKQFQVELERERRERCWAAGIALTPRWDEAFKQEQQSILDTIQKAGKPDDAFPELSPHPPRPPYTGTHASDISRPLPSDSVSRRDGSTSPEEDIASSRPYQMEGRGSTASMKSNNSESATYRSPSTNPISERIGEQVEGGSLGERDRDRDRDKEKSRPQEPPSPWIHDGPQERQDSSTFRTNNQQGSINARQRSPQTVREEASMNPLEEQAFLAMDTLRSSSTPPNAAISQSGDACHDDSDLNFTVSADDSDSLDSADNCECHIFKESLSLLRLVLLGDATNRSIQAQNWRICKELARHDDPVVAISNCRHILIYIEKIVFEAQVEPDLIQATMQRDWIRIVDLFSAILMDDSSVVQLPDIDAKRFLDSLQTLLDKMPMLDSPSGSSFDIKARKLIVKLSKKTGSLPVDLFIQDVSRPQSEAIFGGSFADIYRARYQSTDVALKRIRVFQHDLEKRQTWEKLCREAIVWRKLDHSNVLPFLGIDMDSFPSFCCLVSPWMVFGTINKYLADFGRSRLVRHLEEVVRGLEYLHSQGIAHGDLRGNNILVDGQHCVRLADFGLSVFSDATAGTSSATHGGSIRWMAPELHYPEQFGFDSFCRTPASDMYSYACVIYELYTGLVPWQSIRNDATIILNVIKGLRLHKPLTSPQMPDTLWNVVEQCWRHVASERLTATQVIQLVHQVSST